MNPSKNPKLTDHHHHNSPLLPRRRAMTSAAATATSWSFRRSQHLLLHPPPWKPNLRLLKRNPPEKPKPLSSMKSQSHARRNLQRSRWWTDFFGLFFKNRVKNGTQTCAWSSSNHRWKAYAISPS